MCRVLLVFVVLAHERRRPVQVAVTAHPTAEWTTQQLRDAFPWDTAPRYLLRDRDGRGSAPMNDYLIWFARDKPRIAERYNQYE